MKVVEVAAFPGYLFCQFDVSSKTNILNSPGVHGIVSFSGVPTQIPPAEIESIRRMIDSGAHPVPYLAAGQRVRIEYGALQGMVGILTRDQNGQRLTLSIDLLQRSVCLYIDADQISIV